MPRKRAKLYKRILLKLSGESLQNTERGLNIDPEVTRVIAGRIKSVSQQGIEVAVVVGGGNIFRGLAGAGRGIERSTGDNMGMLATVINALALHNALEQTGAESRVQTAIEMPKIAEPFVLPRALKHLSKGRVMIFAAGTGNPYFSTDTAAALRASEIHADVLLKATKVDGVYTSDPVKDPKARRYTTVTYREALSRCLKVMDAAAFSLCMENRIPIVVFNFFESDSLERLIAGERVGTLVCE